MYFPDLNVFTAQLPPVPNMSFRLALRQYVADPDVLGSDILLGQSERCITIFDKYPKAMFHFLVLPKLNTELTESITTNLATLLKWDKAGALECLEQMRNDAENAKSMIQDEMTKKHGFKWDVLVGFHAVPSMDHIHLHVLSSDLCAPALKKKHHYNSFRSDLGFFLHLEDVLGWFELPTATPFAKGPTFERKAAIPAQKYEPLLKTDLACFKCREKFKTIPQLKAHLQQEWDVQNSQHKSQKRQKVEEKVTEIVET